MPWSTRSAGQIGVITVSDVVRWLANLFPEAVLNLRPGDALKHPEEIRGGEAG